MEEDILRAKFIGCLLGCAVGDALGAFAEGRPVVTCAEIEAQAASQKQFVYTDDTHMTIGVAESLVESRGFDGWQMAWTFIQNYEAEPWRGYGPGPPQVLRMIKGGVSQN